MIWLTVIQFVLLPALMAGIFVFVMRTGNETARTVVGAAGLWLDVYLNYTSFAAFTLDWPKQGEYTFSKRLKRLVLDTGWRGRFANRVKVFLNHYDPDHV